MFLVPLGTRTATSLSKKNNFALLAVRQRMESLAEELFGSTVAGRSAFCFGLAPRGTWRPVSAVCRAIDQFGGARCPSLVSVARCYVGQ
jgi:hypothetical protein